MNSKYDLIICSQMFYPELISTGQTLTELAEALQSKGLKIKVWTGQPTLKSKDKVPNYIHHNGIDIYRVWSTQFNKLSTIGKLINQLTFSVSLAFKLLKESSSTPILSPTNPPFIGHILAMTSLIKGFPFLYLIFDVYPETAINLHLISANNPLIFIWKQLNKFAFYRAKKIIMIGRCMETLIKKQVPTKDHHKLCNIHVWADDSLISTQKNAYNKYVDEWDLNSKKCILYSGNMGRFHDMETLLEAAHQLKENKNIAFRFVGEGYKKQQVSEYVNAHLPNAQVHGYVPKKDLPLTLNMAYIGLVSLLDGQEGLSVPSKTFGLMAAGIPILAVMNKNSEIARVIQEEACGYVIPPGNAGLLASKITYLAEHPEIRNTMSTRAKEAINTKYSLDIACEKYITLLKSL